MCYIKCVIVATANIYQLLAKVIGSHPRKKPYIIIFWNHICEKRYSLHPVVEFRLTHLQNLQKAGTEASLTPERSGHRNDLGTPRRLLDQHLKRPDSPENLARAAVGVFLGLKEGVADGVKQVVLVVGVKIQADLGPAQTLFHIYLLINIFTALSSSFPPKKLECLCSANSIIIMVGRR
jgi:hypothetical protein